MNRNQTDKNSKDPSRTSGSGLPVAEALEATTKQETTTNKKSGTSTSSVTNSKSGSTMTSLYTNEPETSNQKPATKKTKTQPLNPSIPYILLLLFCCVLKTYSQSFNFTVSIDSSAQYANLSGATTLSANAKWLPAYEIPTGFTSEGALKCVRVETNGFVIYNKSLNHAVMAFNGFHCKTDSVAAWSQLSYLSSGNPGSKTLKIQFTNVGLGEDPRELLSYQVWIGENGTMQIAVGPNTYETSVGDTSQVIHLGLINRDMDAATNGLLISGTPQAPAPASINTEQPSLAYLRTVPKRGYRYIFTPNQN